MQQILTEWKSYLKEMKKYKRIVLNEIQELTEEQVKDFPLSQEELEILRNWGSLEGEPLFLGSGTMGSAFQFGNLVCKITSDDAEAMAAAKIAGEYHPNVYKINKVGQRQHRFKEMPNQRFVIVYELVGDPESGSQYPTPPAQEVIKSLHNTTEKIKYRWVNNFPAVLEKALSTLRDNPSIFEIETVGGNNLVRLQKIVDISGMNEQEGAAFIHAWKLINGIYGSCLNNIEKAEVCFAKKEFDYMNQVCLGLTFLFEHGIVFADLKTTNVMRLEDDTLVIIDIGKSVVRGGSSIFDEIK